MKAIKEIKVSAVDELRSPNFEIRIQLSQLQSYSQSVRWQVGLGEHYSTKLHMVCGWIKSEETPDDFQIVKFFCCLLRQ